MRLKYLSKYVATSQAFGSTAVIIHVGHYILVIPVGRVGSSRGQEHFIQPCEPPSTSYFATSQCV